MIMREIKFRAWNKEQNIMCYDNEDKNALYWDYDWMQISTISMINSLFRSEDYIFMQFTWLYDKNWVELYEWDIFWMWYEYEDWTHKYWDRNIIKDIKDFDICDEFCIIWNIYENPNLVI
jgi:hypothetical protein